MAVQSVHTITEAASQGFDVLLERNVMQRGTLTAGYYHHSYPTTVTNKLLTHGFLVRGDMHLMRNVYLGAEFKRDHEAGSLFGASLTVDLLDVKPSQRKLVRLPISSDPDGSSATTQTTISLACFTKTATGYVLDPGYKYANDVCKPIYIEDIALAIYVPNPERGQTSIVSSPPFTQQQLAEGAEQIPLMVANGDRLNQSFAVTSVSQDLGEGVVSDTYTLFFEASAEGNYQRYYVLNQSPIIQATQTTLEATYLASTDSVYHAVSLSQSSGGVCFQNQTYKQGIHTASDCAQNIAPDAQGNKGYVFAELRSVTNPAGGETTGTQSSTFYLASY